ncbi:hypothetical protein DIPPA_27539 [Diplonema papillatum]|nr:hypothetical protein DIPPA_27539 [Diplonema papillatum]|eukprot:gene18975-29225_t
MRAVLCCGALLALACSAEAGLTARAAQPLPTGSVTPQGWLLRQLVLQGEGLSGHLSLFWNDIMNSTWIGGGGDGGLHERTPYWLNGVVPLSFLLKNAGVDLLPGVTETGLYKSTWGLDAHNYCIANTSVDGAVATPLEVAGGVGTSKDCWQLCLQHGKKCANYVHSTSSKECKLYATAEPTMSAGEGECFGMMGVPPVNMTEQVEKYISYILDHQNESTGWLGPDDNPNGHDQYWGPMNVLQALYQYAEGMDDGQHTSVAWMKATQAMLKHLMAVYKRAITNRVNLNGWSQWRWEDMALSAQWLLENAPQGYEKNLTVLMVSLHEQGSAWEQWFENFTGNAGGHNVNNAQAFKTAAVIYRQEPNYTFNGYNCSQLSSRRMQHMDEHYGLPTGMFNGDEILPTPPTRNPSRGIELCGVVEAMFSYSYMYSVFGNLAFADRTELIAYNALPATWASPTGGDMWAHQYLQAVNEINAIYAEEHVWGTDGPYSEQYGLQPNYGCCTANFNQGWPKFAHHLFFTGNDGSLIVGMYAPAVGAFPGGHKINVTTDYPFGDAVTVLVTLNSSSASAVVKLRVPGWAVEATVDGRRVANGTYFEATVTGAQTFVIQLNPKITVQVWDKGAVSVHRGAIMYSLPIMPNYTISGHHYGTMTQSNDYFINPTSMWRYAVDLNASDPSSSFTFSRNGASLEAPFNHSDWANTITGTFRMLPSWTIVNNSADEPPQSPVCTTTPCGAPVQLTLAPHGGTELRIGEFPVSGLSPP